MFVHLVKQAHPLTFTSPLYCKAPFPDVGTTREYNEYGTLILAQTSLHLFIVSRPVVVETARTVRIKAIDLYSNAGCCFVFFFLQWFVGNVCTFNAVITFGFILLFQFDESLTLKITYILFYV